MQTKPHIELTYMHPSDIETRFPDASGDLCACMFVFIDQPYPTFIDDIWDRLPAFIQTELNQLAESIPPKSDDYDRIAQDINEDLDNAGEI